MDDQIPTKQLSTVAWIRVSLHANGALSVEGHIGDKKLACAMLDHAKDAVKTHGTQSQIILPNRDVDMEPSIPLRDVGSMAPHERGDG